MKPTLVTYLSNSKDKFKIEIFFNTNFSKLKNITQVYGIILNHKNNILIVSKDNITWTLPGGSVEPGETLTTTLIREVYEESAVELDPNSIEPFFYQLVYKKFGEEFIFENSQVRYLAKLKSKNHFVIDPGGDIKFQQYVSKQNLGKYLKWRGLENLIIQYI